MVSSHGNGIQESREKFLLLELTTEPSVLPTQLQKSRKDIKEGIKMRKKIRKINLYFFSAFYFFSPLSQAWNSILRNYFRAAFLTFTFPFLAQDKSLIC